MAYLLTTATSVNDIFNTIATFAAGIGYTVQRNNTFTSGANNRRMLSLSHTTGDYVHFFSEASTTTNKTQVFCMRSIGIDTAGDFLAQPNRGTYSSNNLLSAGPYVNFWLFGENGANPYIHCVLEHASGRYRHFGVGELVKMGTWTGGSYNYGTNWAQGASEAGSPTDTQHNTPLSECNSSSTQTTNVSCIRCDNSDATANSISGVDDRYLPYNTGSSRRCNTGFRGTNNGMRYLDNGMGISGYAFSNYNQRTHLLHLRHFVTVAANYWRQIGEPPALRALNINPFVAGEEYTIGSDIWKVFPLVRKGVISGQESSGIYGLAYKKVV